MHIGVLFYNDHLFYKNTYDFLKEKTKEIIMKIKIMMYISALAAIPSMQAGFGHFERMAGLTEGNAQWDCYATLSEGRDALSIDDPLLQAVKNNFHDYNTTRDETLFLLLGEETTQIQDQNIMIWILNNKRGYSLENISKLTSYLRGDLPEKEAVKMALKFSTDDTHTSIDTSIMPEPASTPPSPQTPVKKEPETSHNPFLGKKLEALLNLSDKDPSLNNDTLFQEALNEVLGGDRVAIHMDDFIRLFPLHSLLEGSCNREQFRTVLTASKSKDRGQDTYEVPVLSAFLRENNLSAIKTPGFGNCAFDAVLLAWFCREELYAPQWNTAFGAYLEAVIGSFREEIADDVSPESRSIVRTKNKYVDQDVFSAIAKKLESTIILLYTLKTTVVGEIFTPEGISFTLIPGASVVEFLDTHPDALCICYNGSNHFAAIRKEPYLPALQ